MAFLLAGEGLAQAPMAYWKFRTTTAGDYWDNETGTQTDCSGSPCDYPFARWVDGAGSWTFPGSSMAFLEVGNDCVTDGYLRGDRMGFTGGSDSWREFGYYPVAGITASDGDVLSCNYITNGPDDLTIEFMVRFGTNCFEPYILSYPDIGFESQLTNAGFRFQLNTDDNGTTDVNEHTIPFDMLDRRSRAYYTDAQWHHIAIRYAKAGMNGSSDNQFKVWVDGYSEQSSAFESYFVAGGMDPEMAVDVANCPGSPSGNYSRIFVGAKNPATDRFDGDLDEIAIWRHALDDDLIKQHYHQMWCAIQEGDPHATPVVYFNSFDAGYTCSHGSPTINPVFAGSLDLDQFPVDYVASPFTDNVGVITNAVDQVLTYPTPRFRPGHDLHRNVPFVGNTDITLGVHDDGTAQTASDRIDQTVDILEELALQFNYYILAVNNVAGYKQARLNAGSTNLQQALIGLANQYSSTTGNPIDRCAVHYWLGLRPSDVIGVHSSISLPSALSSLSNSAPTSNAYVSRGNLPDVHGLSHYCNSGTSAPWGAGAPFGAQDPNYSGLTPNFIEMDGQTLVGLYDWIYGNGTTHYLLDPVIHYIAENGEEGMDICNTDTDFLALKSSYTCINPSTTCWEKVDDCNEEFWQYRRFLRREEYASQLLNTSLNGIGSTLTNTPYSWYYNSGLNGSYPFFRDLNYNAKLGGNVPTQYFYPQTPTRWYASSGNKLFTGMDVILESRRIEFACGDQYFAPYVSPQVNDGNNYFQEDQEAMRPGQYLGVMKLMMNMGAAYYHAFYAKTYPDPDDWNPICPACPDTCNQLPTNVNEPDCPVVGDYGIGGTEFSVWQMVMPPYAQALITRFEDDYADSEALEGDWDQFLGPVGDPQYLFWTGDMNFPVAVRQSQDGGNPIDRFMITGAIMTTTLPSQGENTPRTANVTIDLDAHPSAGSALDSITFEVRRQGSTYIYDRVNAGGTSGKPPVFYQIDRWHEVSHPEHWDKAFRFEAEVDDGLTAATTGETFEIWTETPSGGSTSTPTDNDYSVFTSYLHVNQTANPGLDCWNWYGNSTIPANALSASYIFDVRDATDQGTLYLAVRARTEDPTVPTGLFYELYDASNTVVDDGYLNSISTATWEWYGWDEVKSSTVAFSSLSVGRYRLRLIPINSEVEIDQILLTPNATEYADSLDDNDDGSTLPLVGAPSPSIGVSLSGCVGGYYDATYTGGGTDLGACPLYEWTLANSTTDYGTGSQEQFASGTGGTVYLTIYNEPGVSGTDSELISAPCKWSGQPEAASSSGLSPGESFEAYPNPTGGELELRLDLQWDQELKVEFVNSAGKVARVRTIPSGQYAGKMDLNDLPDGLYMMRLVIPGRDIGRKVLLVK